MVLQNPKPYLANSPLWEPHTSSEEGMFLWSPEKLIRRLKKLFDEFWYLEPNSVFGEVDVSKGVLLQRVVLIGISKEQDSRSRIAVFDIPKDAVASFDILKAVGASFDISKDVGSEFWHLKKQKDFGDQEKQMWHLENSQT
jgi:hypothetical protein